MDHRRGQQNPPSPCRCRAQSPRRRDAPTGFGRRPDVQTAKAKNRRRPRRLKRRTKPENRPTFHQCRVLERSRRSRQAAQVAALNASHVGGGCFSTDSNRPPAFRRAGLAPPPNSTLDRLNSVAAPRPISAQRRPARFRPTPWPSRLHQRWVRQGIAGKGQRGNLRRQERDAVFQADRYPIRMRVMSLARAQPRLCSQR